MRAPVVALTLTLLGSLAGAVPNGLGFTPAQYGLVSNGTIYARQIAGRSCPPGYGICPNTRFCVPIGSVCCGISGRYCDGYEAGELCFDEIHCCRIGSALCRDGYGVPITGSSATLSGVRPSSTGDPVPNPPLVPTDPEMTGLTLRPTATRSVTTYTLDDANFPGPTIVDGAGNAGHRTNVNGGINSADPNGNAANTQGSGAGNPAPTANNGQTTGAVNGSGNANGSGNGNTNNNNMGSGNANPSPSNGASTNLPAVGPIGLALAAVLLV